jgi:hypothetical protein
MCDAIRPDLETARLLDGVITDWPAEARATLAALSVRRADLAFD